jgi:putative ABC transport system ATP-binding protein
MSALLEASELARSFGRTEALRGVSLEVAQGEILAVTGPSGGGKSTLLHCLSGIMRPDSGEVRYRGERIDAWPESRRSKLRRSEFGIVFQFGQLVPELSARDNVALPLLLAGTGRPEALATADSWLDRLEVIDVAAGVPGQLSGGEQQRVAIARALVTGPRVLFADEPTGALDTLAGEQVLTLMVRLARAQRTAIVLVTHDPVVAGYADRELVLRDGRWDESGVGLEPHAGRTRTALIESMLGELA